MNQSLGEALPEAIAKVSELIGSMEAQAKELDDTMPGAGQGTRMVVTLIKMQRDAAVAAQQSGDVVRMIHAYQQMKPSLELATAE